MAANNVYYPQIKLTESLKSNNFLLIDDQLTGLPLKITLETFFTKVLAANLLPISFLDLTDTPTSLGTVGQLLQVNSAGNALEFTSPNGLVTTFSTKTLDFTATSLVKYYLVDTSSNDIDVDLDPTTLPIGTTIYFIKIALSNTYNLIPASGLINGQAVIPITGHYDVTKVVTDGTNFYIL